MFPVVLIQLIVALIIVGLALYILNIVPLDATLKQIIRAVIIVVICIWLLYFLVGFMPSGGWGMRTR